MTDDGDMRQRLVERLRAAGYSDERIIAELVVDNDVIDRMKAAGRLGLLRDGDQDRRSLIRRWVKVEMLHALYYGRELPPDDLRAEFEAALEEFHRPPADG